MILFDRDAGGGTVSDDDDDEDDIEDDNLTDSRSHLWVDKYAPHRYTDLLSEEVGIWDKLRVERYLATMQFMFMI